jgi:hypothetical protein
MSKKKSKSPNQALSPKKYILTKARTLPIYKCMINKNWEEASMAHVIVCRKHSNGNITAGIFLIDILVKGLQDSFEIFNQPEIEFEEILEKIYGNDNLSVEISYTLAHNIVYGGIEFADEQGYDGKKKVGVSLYILEEDTEEIELIDIDFGAESYLAKFGEELDDDNWDEDDWKNEDFESFRKQEWHEYIREHQDLPFLEDKEIVRLMFMAILFEEDKKTFEVPYSIADLPIVYEATNETLGYIKQIREFDDLNSAILELDKVELEKIIPKLKTEMSRIPDNPIPSDLLAKAYVYLGMEKEHYALVEDCIHRFPGDFSTKLNYGNLLLDRNQLDVFETYFPDPYTPMAFFPKRKVFHAIEIIPLAAIMLRYFVKKKDALNSMRFSELIYQLVLESERESVLQTADIAVLALQEFMVFKVEYIQDYIHKNDLLD